MPSRTRCIDFGTPLTTFTFRDRDLGIALNHADPVLSGILRRYAETVAQPRPATWLDHFQQALDAALWQARTQVFPGASGRW